MDIGKNDWENASNKMSKTIGSCRAPISASQVQESDNPVSKFYAHDEKGEAKVGDRVRIQETRPLSKMKCWRLIEVIGRDAEAAYDSSISVWSTYAANSFHFRCCG